MAFLSELIGRPVTDVDGKYIGKLQDLVARFHGEMTHPVIEAIVVRHAGVSQLIPFSSTAVLISRAIPLNCRLDQVEQYQSGEQDVFLAQDVLDKLIIDTEGARVVRVNDLELLRVNGSVLVSNVDVSSLGIIRRIGLAGAARSLLGLLHIKPQQTFISWKDVELLRQDQSMRLKVPVKKLHDLHPADVAEIISDLNRQQSGQFIEALDLEHLADALEEVEPDFQASLMQNLPDEKVADVLEEMEPDEAADLLAELPEERSRDLLELMEKEDADDVRMLLAYPEESAGGIMTTEFASVPPVSTAAQALQILRETADKAETVFYIYVTDQQEHLVGVISLKALVFARPDALVSEFMQTRLISVLPLDEQDEVAQVISKYDLLAVPVVDEENRLIGIVTADDALDKIIPTAWKKRLPRFFR